jgi:ribonuclease-3
MADPTEPEQTGLSRDEAMARFAIRFGLSPDSPHLRSALTHRSAASDPAQSSERLEFLGDALLGAFVARVVWETLPPHTNEHGLTRARVSVIRKETIAQAARELGVADLLRVGVGERKEGRQQGESLLADAYEALVATVFLDKGQAAMETFIRKTLREPLNAVSHTPPPPDPKSRLQVLLQTSGRGIPVYVTTRETGEGAHHHFVVEVREATGTVLGVGDGKNKREAQVAAAVAALENSLVASSTV